MAFELKCCDTAFHRSLTGLRNGFQGLRLVCVQSFRGSATILSTNRGILAAEQCEIGTTTRERKVRKGSVGTNPTVGPTEGVKDFQPWELVPLMISRWFSLRIDHHVAWLFPCARWPWVPWSTWIALYIEHVL
jgi:hypothetical protein